MNYHVFIFPSLKIWSIIFWQKVDLLHKKIILYEHKNIILYEDKN